MDTGGNTSGRAHGLAGRYATALFELASGEKAIDTVEASLGALAAALAESAELKALTQSPIEPEDQAEAVFLLVSQRLAKTTGHVIPVDGGLQDGFLR